jgi:hypothetical protein
MDAALAFQAALANAVTPPELDQLRLGQSAQPVQQNRLRQRRDQLQPQAQLSVNGHGGINGVSSFLP